MLDWAPAPADATISSESPRAAKASAPACTSLPASILSRSASVGVAVSTRVITTVAVPFDDCGVWMHMHIGGAMGAAAPLVPAPPVGGGGGAPGQKPVGFAFESA